MSETAPKHDAHELETSNAQRPSVRVIEAVAAATGTDPLAMEPLYGVIDPDALDALFSRGIEGHVQFEFCDSEVELHSDGRLLVDGDQQDR